MEFRVLGPLEAWHGGRRLPLGAGRQRVLLALLLLRPNEVLSTDRLVDELWGERPPATAVKVLQGYVSQLRRALSVDGVDGAEILETRPPGYALNVAPDGLDARRFETLLERGRALLESDPSRAADVLLEALALWRGEPLPEVAYEPFAQAEIGRLHELRLAAVEERVEADLRLGRHRALVPELETLVAAHPLRERLRGQLMLALYRCHRQADALEVYQQGRRLLVDELGLEPGERLQALERAILNHDPSLEPAAGAPVALAPRERRSLRRLPLIASAAALALIGAAAVTAFVLARDERRTPTVVPNSVVKIDPETNRIADVVRVGRGARAVAAVGRTVWVANSLDDTLTRVDPRSGATRTLGGVQFPSSLAEEGERIWVGNDSSGELVAIDRVTGSVVERVRLPGAARATYVAYGGGSIWVSEAEVAIYRVRLATRRVTRVPDAGTHAVAFGHGAAWVIRGGPGEVLRIDARDGTLNRIAVGSLPSGVAVGFGAVWVASANEDAVWRVGAITGDVDDVVDVGDRPGGVATGVGSVWVANSGAGTVSRIDPHTNEVVATVRTGHSPVAVAAGPDAIWVTVGGEP